MRTDLAGGFLLHGRATMLIFAFVGKAMSGLEEEINSEGG